MEVEKKPVGRPPRNKTFALPEGPCVICKRVTKEQQWFPGDRNPVYMHTFDCTDTRMV